MRTSVDIRPSRRRRLGKLGAALAALALIGGLTATVLVSNEGTASAATMSFSQCNAHGPGPLGAPLSVTCSISVVNTIDATGGTSTVVTQRVCTLEGCTGDVPIPTNTVNAIHQCNGSDNVGGSTTVCTVDIVNNISKDAPAAPSAITLNQCIGSGGGGGTLMTACIPSSTTAATVTQCNGSGTGGGGFMDCTATGTVSADFPVTVDQCNGSENGGGSTVTCTVSMTTNVVDTSLTTGGTTPGGLTPGTPGTPGSPFGFVPGLPVAPPVLFPPNLTG